MAHSNWAIRGAFTKKDSSGRRGQEVVKSQGAALILTARALSEGAWGRGKEGDGQRGCRGRSRDLRSGVQLARVCCVLARCKGCHPQHLHHRFCSPGKWGLECSWVYTWDPQRPERLSTPLMAKLSVKASPAHKLIAHGTWS